MNESIHKYMKVGIVHFMAYPQTINGEGPILETIKNIILDDFFDAIEITWIKDSKIRNEAKNMLTSSHMTVCYGAHPSLLSTGLNINSLDEKARQQAIDILKEGIDQAYEINSVGFVFLSGKYTENKKEEAFTALIESTKQLCAYAQAQGNLKIIHEMFDHSIDKKSLIGPAPLANKYAQEVTKEYDNFGLLVDLSHIPLIGEKPHEAIYPVKDYLVHAHIGNCVMSDSSLPGYGDLHPRFGFPDSVNDVDELVEFLKVLLDIGFLNDHKPPIVSFEIKPFGSEDPDVVIANAKRTLVQAWAKL